MRQQIDTFYSLVLSGSLGLLCMAGTVYFLVRNSRYRISHLMLGVWLFGTLMILIRWWAMSEYEAASMQWFAMASMSAFLAPFIGYGIDCGARNEEACADQSVSVRWAVFGAGLVLAFAMVASLIIGGGLLLTIISDVIGLDELVLPTLLFGLSLLPILITAKCRARARNIATRHAEAGRNKDLKA